MKLQKTSQLAVIFTTQVLMGIKINTQSDSFCSLFQLFSSLKLRQLMRARIQGYPAHKKQPPPRTIIGPQT